MREMVLTLADISKSGYSPPPVIGIGPDRENFTPGRQKITPPFMFYNQ
jgi:hypothetical protein